MNFGNWSDIGNFRRFWEFINSHAFVEEVEQPFRHNATNYEDFFDTMQPAKKI